jgi:hypothetical protein
VLLPKQEETGLHCAERIERWIYGIYHARLDPRPARLLDLSLSETLSGWRAGANRVKLIPMVDVLILLSTALTSLFRSRVRLEAEILVLRQPINVLRRARRADLDRKD